MNDVRVGRIVRAIRTDRGLRQEDVAAPIDVDRSVMTDLEAGRLEAVSLRTARRLCGRLGIDLIVEARWRGGAVDRLLDRDHAAIVERVSRVLTAAGWQVELEFTFNEFGDRGSVDVLGWHPVDRALLIVEVKSTFTDLQAMLMTLSRKVRVVPKVAARERGWDRRSLGRILVVIGTSRNRRVVGSHRSVFDATFPSNTLATRQWIHAPTSDFAGLWFVSPVALTHTRTRVRSPHRPCRA